MRQSINPQMQLGEVDISTITFNLKSRDDIPRLLLALQYIWTNIELRNQVTKVLADMISADQNNGRPGMNLWRIMVFVTVRLVTNCDYDSLLELASSRPKSKSKSWGQVFHCANIKPHLPILKPLKKETS